MLPEICASLLSLPPRGAWIEMSLLKSGDLFYDKSLPPRGAWIEIERFDKIVIDITSLPPRGAWIEIGKLFSSSAYGTVAPPAGSVD